MIEIIMLPFAFAGVVCIIDIAFFQGRIGVELARVLPFVRH